MNEEVGIWSVNGNGVVGASVVCMLIFNVCSKFSWTLKSLKKFRIMIVYD